MTDLPAVSTSILNRLQTMVRLEGGEQVLQLAPGPPTCRLGSIRASVLSYVVDVVTGVSCDTDPECWTFTSDMRVVMQPIPAPTRIEARSANLRDGKRSATCETYMTDERGEVVGYGIAGFSRVPRRPGDRPKVVFDVELARQFRAPPLEQLLPEAAGIRIIDGPQGIVEIDIVADLQNPAGTLQGAMIGLVAEVAAEELASARLAEPALICELDIRYLHQARIGPVRTRCQWLGDRPDSPIIVELWDATTDVLLSHVIARAG